MGCVLLFDVIDRAELEQSYPRYPTMDTFKMKEMQEDMVRVARCAIFGSFPSLYHCKLLLFALVLLLQNDFFTKHFACKIIYL